MVGGPCLRSHIPETYKGLNSHAAKQPRRHEMSRRKKEARSKDGGKPIARYQKPTIVLHDKKIRRILQPSKDHPEANKGSREPTKPPGEKKF